MLLLVFSGLLFATVTAAAYAVWLQVATEKHPVSARLRQIRAMHPTGGGALRLERPPLMLELIARFGGFLPMRDGKDALRSGLITAGFRGLEAPMVFLGSKALLAVLLPLVWVGVATLQGRSLGNALVVSAALAAAGFYLPSLYLSARKRRRQDEIRVSLPDALDLLVVCVEAGLGMAAAIQRVSSEIRLASGALADELALVHQQMQAGISRADALRNLAQRSGVDEVYSLVALMIQTDRLGTSVAQALRAHADSMRVRRKQRAEQMARKASVKLAFPLVFLVLPALLIIILGPAAIELMKALVMD